MRGFVGAADIHAGAARTGSSPSSTSIEAAVVLGLRRCFQPVSGLAAEAGVAAGCAGGIAEEITGLCHAYLRSVFVPVVIRSSRRIVHHSAGAEREHNKNIVPPDRVAAVVAPGRADRRATGLVSVWGRGHSRWRGSRLGGRLSGKLARCMSSSCCRLCGAVTGGSSQKVAIRHRRVALETELGHRPMSPSFTPWPGRSGRNSRHPSIETASVSTSKTIWSAIASIAGRG